MCVHVSLRNLLLCSHLGIRFLRFDSGSIFRAVTGSKPGYQDVDRQADLRPLQRGEAGVAAQAGHPVSGGFAR